LNGQLGQELVHCFALEKAIAPLALVDQLPRAEPQLEDLKRRLEKMATCCISQYLDFQRIMVRLALA